VSGLDGVALVVGYIALAAGAWCAFCWAIGGLLYLAWRGWWR